MKLCHRIATIVVGILLLFFVVCLLEKELQSTLGEEAEGKERHGRQNSIFHRRFLNREEASAEGAPAPPKSHPEGEGGDAAPVSTATRRREPRDEFPDLFKYTTLSPDFRQYMEWPPFYRLPPNNPTLADHLKLKMEENMTNWEKFHLQISKYALYPEDATYARKVMEDMATLKITALEQLPGGTQIKLLMTFENGGQALFKPMRFPREVETLPNHFYFTDYERHVSEIASFHLDKLLGFRRAPPCVGRKVNISSEIYPLAEPELHKTFFVSPAGNVCFHGQCSYYCDTSHAVCGEPEMLEGSLSVWLPPRSVLDRKPGKSPWRRSYHKRRKAAWENDPYYCVNQVKTVAPYNRGRRLYDVMDLAIFDYLTGNMDRHHYDEILTFGNESTIIHWDHGRGFGRASHDELSALVPLLQCCSLRLSTFNTLFRFHVGPVQLSDAMRDSMASDPVAPVLIASHLYALDRRVGKVLQGVRDCLDVNDPANVFLDDVMDAFVPEQHLHRPLV